MLAWSAARLMQSVNDWLDLASGLRVKVQKSTQNSVGAVGTCLTPSFLGDSRWLMDILCASPSCPSVNPVQRTDLF